MDFDRQNHVWLALSLYEHPRRPSTSETLTILKALVPNFSLATPNKNHGWVTLILYEHPRRPSTTEILTILGLRSSFVEDIPVKASMPNLVQLYQKTLLEKLFLTGFFVDAILFFGRKTSVVEVFQHYV